MIEIILLGYAGVCFASALGQWLSRRQYERSNKPLNIKYPREDVSLAIQNIKEKLGNNIFFNKKSRKMQYNKNKNEISEVMFKEEITIVPEKPKENVVKINWNYYKKTKEENEKDLIKAIHSI